MTRLRRTLGIALFIASGTAFAAATPAWVARSDAYTQPVLKDTGKYAPEESTELGDESFDGAVSDFKPRDYERELADTERRLKELRAQRAGSAIRRCARTSTSWSIRARRRSPR